MPPQERDADGGTSLGRESKVSGVEETLILEGELLQQPLAREKQDALGQTVYLGDEGEFVALPCVLVDRFVFKCDL